MTRTISKVSKFENVFLFLHKYLFGQLLNAKETKIDNKRMRNKQGKIFESPLCNFEKKIFCQEIII